MGNTIVPSTWVTLLGYPRMTKLRSSSVARGTVLNWIAHTPSSVSSKPMC